MEREEILLISSTQIFHLNRNKILCVCAERWHFSLIFELILILQANNLYRSWYQWQRFRLCPCATKWRGQSLRRRRAPGTWAPPSCPWSRTLCSRLCHTPAAPLWTTKYLYYLQTSPAKIFFVVRERVKNKFCLFGSVQAMFASLAFYHLALEFLRGLCLITIGLISPLKTLFYCGEYTFKVCIRQSFNFPSCLESIFIKHQK